MPSNMMKSCQEVSMLVSQSLDERLPWYQRLQVRLHLLLCSACTQFERQVSFIRHACAELGQRSARSLEQ